MYYRARYYNPNIGRFVSHDPLSLKPMYGDFDPYNYVLNNPILMNDPSGLLAEIDKSCNCPQPFGGGSGPGYGGGDLASRIKVAITSACAKVDTMITHPLLRECLKRTCEEGRIECSEKCRYDFSEGENYVEWGNPGNSRSTATYCIKNWEWRMSDQELGDLAIHEWAHGCGWIECGGAMHNFWGIPYGCSVKAGK